MDEFRTLATQEGVISRRQALACGLSSSAIGRRVDAGEWKQVFAGVYRHVAAPVSDLLMLHAARLWLPPTAVLWGTWAAWWHEMRPEPEGPVSMTVPRSHNGRSHRHVALRRRDLDPVDVTSIRGFRVTKRPLTALENAHLPGGRATFDRALQRHLQPAELDKPIERLWHAYGVVAARESAGLARDGSVSHPERTLAAALRKAGLSQIVCGSLVKVGSATYWLDFSIESMKLVIEVDGYKAHTEPEVFQSDRKRQNALVLDKWTILRFTAWEIRNEIDAVIAQIRAALVISA